MAATQILSRITVNKIYMFRQISVVQIHNYCWTAGVANLLAESGINVSYMTVTRSEAEAEAIMAIGIDGSPPKSVLQKIPSVAGIIEFTVFSEKGLMSLT